MSTELNQDATPAEQQLIDQAAAEASAAATPTADEAAAAQAAADAKAAQDAADAAAAQAAAAAAAPPAPTPVVQITPDMGVDASAPPKDWNASIAALDEQYEAGDLSVSEYVKATNQITAERTQYETLVATQAAHTRAAKEAADAAFNDAASRFIAANTIYNTAPMLRSMLQAAINAVDDGSMSPDQLFAKAHQAVNQQLTAAGLATVPAAPKAPEPPNRQPDLSNVRSLQGLPAAASNGGTDGEIDSLANMAIDDLELFLAQNPGKVGDLLARAPGGQHRFN